MNCPDCGGTILAPTRGGVPRGTCRCALGQVFVLRAGTEEEWRVEWCGRVCSPTWREKGPAQAYLAGLRDGSRRPEYGPLPDGQIKA